MILSVFVIVRGNFTSPWSNSPLECGPFLVFSLQVNFAPMTLLSKVRTLSLRLIELMGMLFGGLIRGGGGGGGREPLSSPHPFPSRP